MLTRVSGCPDSAPYSSHYGEFIGDGDVDFSFGLRIPQAPGFNRDGKPVEPNTKLGNEAVCVDLQARATVIGHA